MKDKVKKILTELPKNPGVYIMKNSGGKIIYIGKSINLKTRVNSYFNGKAKLNFAKQNMVSLIKDIDFIETKNETEALVLETNLIKINKPKYNILMKDDKNLLYIKITEDPIPEVIKTRIKTNSGEYFGPYPSTSNITNVLGVLKKIFKIRSCHIEFNGINNQEKPIEIKSKRGMQSIPCIDFYIGLCDAPCKLEKDIFEKYKNNIENFRNFMKGNKSEILKNLEEKMLEKAKNLEFEEALKIKNQIKSIEDLGQKQLARDSIPGNNDVIVLLEKYGKIFVSITEIRNGEISGIVSSKIENSLEEDKTVVLEEYLQNRYVENYELLAIKLTIITQEDITNKPLLDYFQKKKIPIKSPSIGVKSDIINFTKNNLLNFAYREELGEISKRTLTRQTQNNILQKIGYEEKKKGDIVFECYDISHLGGTNTVASRSVIINGKTETSKYKKYKLNTIKSGEIDDFKSMGEILTRRTLEVLKGGTWPDLLIIDGGKGQLSSAIKAIKSTIENLAPTLTTSGEGEVQNIYFPNICSLAKREEEVFVPNESESIIFEKGTPELALIQKIRDEAHRFAINFNRQKRNKEMKKNILEEIPGFGPKARQKLLKLAGNIDNIRNIPKEELMKIINKNQIESLEEYGIIG